MTYKFFAFISYSHRDIEEARKLQHMLEHYNLPSSIKKKNPDLPKKFKIFRDRDELTSLELHKQLHQKLEESKYLIIICSPDSAKSEYVSDEIAYFRSLGREDKIIPFIVRGEPHSPTNECFNKELLACGEILGIDVQTEEAPLKPFKFHKAFIRLVAAMLELDFGELWNRRKHYFIKQVIATVAIVMLIIALAVTSFAAQPFDASFSINTSVKSLPLSTDGTDSVYLHLEDGDTRALPLTSLDKKIVFQNIPGKYHGSSKRITCSAYGFNDTDTLVTLANDNNLNLTRIVETFGHIHYLLADNDTEEPLVGAEVDFGFMKVKTNDKGILDVLIPLDNQRDSYNIKITHNGKTRHLQYSEGEDIITAMQSDEELTLYIRSL